MEVSCSNVVARQAQAAHAKKGISRRAQVEYARFVPAAICTVHHVLHVHICKVCKERGENETDDELPAYVWEVSVPEDFCKQVREVENKRKPEDEMDKEPKQKPGENGANVACGAACFCIKGMVVRAAAARHQDDVWAGIIVVVTDEWVRAEEQNPPG